ncbi:AraC family transcriptional regulator [Brenneria izbisi]|uniref:AraC family transcriptional regulator n=1 Tax=Brenneria izbisi TaxID=2939450 RepID=A0AA42C699_9GAMM|nr:AraC family transcriptional regulator [Brenneria izbisi]MCV9880071.1 AraC family transcriptional regulator [Brenneria izbisi]MCV9883460.1 AraC family transcriptional regulator [Brenneria izbisi]
MTQLDRLAEIIGRHAADDGVNSCPLPGVKLLRSSVPTMPIPVIYEPTLCLIAQGRKQAMLGTTAFVYDPATYMMASVDLPVMGSVIEASAERPYLCLQISLNMAELGELAIRYPMPLQKAHDFPLGLTLNRTTPELLNAAVRLASLLDTPEDIGALAPLVLQEILYRLLTGDGGNTIRHMVLADSRLNHISRAIVWIKTHFRETCPVEQAAEIAGMSRSTFHAHFKAVTLMSPLEFRTRLRMLEAQRLMISDALDAASAGFRVGYASPSQFSRDYARIFGMPPARHAAQLRRTMPT